MAQLEEWGASIELQLAGLCHACYGTDGFAPMLLDLAERPVLVKSIGAEAESLVYLYGSCVRRDVYPQLGAAVVEFSDRFSGEHVVPSDDQLRGFAELTAANELDVVRHNAELATQHGPALQQLFALSSAHLSPGAQKAWATTQQPAGA